MMDENEIKANYLDIHTDISKLENFEKVHKPINDVANKLFGVPAIHAMTIKDINMFMTRQLILNNIVNTFLGRTSMSEASLAGTALAEIKTSIDN